MSLHWGFTSSPQRAPCWLLCARKKGRSFQSLNSLLPRARTGCIVPKSFSSATLSDIPDILAELTLGWPEHDKYTRSGATQFRQGVHVHAQLSSEHTEKGSPRTLAKSFGYTGCTEHKQHPQAFRDGKTVLATTPSKPSGRVRVSQHNAQASSENVTSLLP